MHFCVSAARVSLAGIAPPHLLTSAFFSPRKMGTNWFMPALVKSRFGESGKREELGTMVCCFSRKKSRKDCLIWAEVSIKIPCRLPRLGHAARLRVWGGAAALGVGGFGCW